MSPLVVDPMASKQAAEYGPSPQPLSAFTFAVPGLGPCKPYVPCARWSLVSSANEDKKVGGRGTWDMLLQDLLRVLVSLTLAAEGSSSF